MSIALILDLEYLNRSVAENRTRIVRAGGIYYRAYRLASITEGAFSMRIIRCPHDAIRADDIELIQAEWVALEGGITVVMPVMARPVIDMLDNVVIAEAVKDEFGILERGGNPSNAAFRKYDLEIRVAIEYPTEYELAKGFSKGSE
jgi:hypothetical protein